MLPSLRFVPSSNSNEYRRSLLTGAGLDCEESRDDGDSQKWVILLHGLFATQHSMRRMQQRLQQCDFQVINWSYATLWHSTTGHAQRLRKTLDALQAKPEVRSIHFVTHSMGGILARAALHYGSADKVQRMVMLAPPNRGSKLTRFSPGALSWCIPAINDLIESPDSLPSRLPMASHIQVGIIAAAHDLVVSLESTNLPNQQEHCVVPTNHFRLPTDRSVMEKVVHFLEHGQFTPQPIRSLAS